jgi:RHS repeat-associated protein
MDGEVTAYVYDAANRLTSAGGVEYTWDQNGNLLDVGVRTYEYDYADVLVQVVSGTFTTTFAYNGDGHRVAKAENGVTTTYVVAVLGLSQVLVETTDGSSIRYVYGHDLLAEHDGEAWAWHLNDGLGSVRQLADGNGEVTLAQGYTPFGVPMWNEGNGSTGYGFTGERWEAYTGLLFLRARYYEPGMGRFISKDPWSGDAQRPLTLHGWSYSQNNPSNTIDPTGMMPTETSVQSGAHSFSCRCGWIDWGHASPRTARAIKDGIQCELELDLGSPDYKVIDTGSPFPLTGGLAVVGRHLSEKEQKQVALGIFMSLEEEVEELQSGIGQLTLA